ncbi:MAG: hypothetical protein EP343_15440 [Deltaproteobacteria bacterium]|nr:MAG: hypothetical protein EP343_15440 [Deltaproteobacteria bacterium]
MICHRLFRAFFPTTLAVFTLGLCLTGLWGCGAATCPMEAIQVTYSYETSCNDVGEKKGTITWNVPASVSSPKEVHRQLLEQTASSKLFIDEVLLEWNPKQCVDGSNSESTPLTVMNYVRIVLAPESGSTLQRLLACEPIASKPPGTLQRDYLFACRTGQSSQGVCTLSFKLQTNN